MAKRDKMTLGDLYMMLKNAGVTYKKMAGIMDAMDAIIRAANSQAKAAGLREAAQIVTHWDHPDANGEWTETQASAREIVHVLLTYAERAERA
jgi:hypothetical protein